jgi:prepilin-type N-terminal cleavage/methylation domain-containing protein
MGGRTRRIRRPGQAGMTLLELMIVLGILSIASDAMFSLLLASYRVYWKGDVATQVQQGGRIALSRMIRDVRAGRHLINNVTRTAGVTTVTFNTACAPNPPQISVVQPHLGNITLADGSTIYAPDASAGPSPPAGTIPYDGYDVTYYLAATLDGTTPNTNGPYLIRAVYDINAGTIVTTNVATNVTSLGFSAAGACPTTATREFTMTITASQTQAGQGVSSKIVIVDDVTLRNQ